MGQNNSKKSLKTINDDIETIRTNIRQSKGKLSADSRQALEHTLVNYSKQVDALGRRSKRKSIDNTQRLISKTTSELLAGPNDEHLDKGAIETHSFINLTKKKTSDNGTTNLSTLDQVDQAINSLKLDLTVAVSNQDTERLRILKKSIEHLATELEMIQVNDYIDLQQRKENYEKILQNLYGKINKTRRQIERDGNIRYLSDYKQKQQQLVGDLNEIETALDSTKSLQALNDLKQHIDTIQGDDGVVAKKQQILTKFQQKYEEVAINEQKLQQAIDSLAKFRKEIEKIAQNPNSDETRRAENYLKQLKDYVAKLPDINGEFAEKRQQFYTDLEKAYNSLIAKPITKNIDGFYSYWMEIQESLQPSKYNSSELSSIQQLLSTLVVLIQRKIDEITNFTRQKPGKDSPDLVKVKVKITDSPRIYSSINLPQIESELVQIRNQIKDRRDYDNLKRSLDDYRELLTNLRQQKSVTDLLSLIDDINEMLDEKQRLSTTRHSSSDDILNDIFVISTRVNEYGAKLLDPKTSENESHELRQHLLEYRKYLHGLNVKNPNIKKGCDDVLQQIAEYLANFDENLQQNTLKRRVDVLKEKIDRFSGTYKNVLYNKLDEDLCDCLDKAEMPQLRNEIETYRKILEEKAIKDTAYNRSPSIDIRAKLAKIREDVDGVIADLNNINDLKTKDDYLALDGRLTLSILALDNLQIITDRSLMDERENLYHEIQRYLNYINEKIALIEQTPIINDTSNDNDDDDDDDDVIIVELRTKKSDDGTDVVEEMESKFERIKREIYEFIGDQNCDKFTQLDDELIEITLNLDKYKFDKNSEMNNKKLQLLKDIQTACEVLDEKVNHFEQLCAIEQQINEVLTKIQQFNANNCTDYDYNRLDEQLINLNVKTRKLQVDAPLLEKRNNCIKLIEECFKKLSEIPKNTNGTLV